MEKIKCLLLVLMLSICTGCAFLGNSIMHHNCAFGGVDLDLMSILYPPTIIRSYGLSIPFGIIDFVPTLVFDTLTAGNHDGSSCPPWSERK